MSRFHPLKPGETKPVLRVFQYGLPDLLEGEAVVREQLHLAHVYYNTKTEAEWGRRAAVREAQLAYGDVRALTITAQRADDVVTALYRALKARRADARARLDPTPEEAAALREAKDVAKTARKAMQKARNAALKDPAVMARIEAIEERATELMKSIRAHNGLAWGTGGLVDLAVGAARKKVPLWKRAWPNNPELRASELDGEGHVAVQISGGVPAAQVFTTCGTAPRTRGQKDRPHTQLRIATVDTTAWTSPVRGERRRQSRTTLALRVESDASRRPVWATWSMIMHRPLPEGSVVKGAAVSLCRVGPREVWTVEVSVDVTHAVPHPEHNCGQGTLSIDVGWRMIDGEMRLAVCHGDDGARYELRLDAAMQRELRAPAALRAIRDRNFDRELPVIGRALKALADPPAWLLQATRTLPHWGSIARLTTLARYWKTHRFAGDERVYEPLEAWRYQDHHLWTWECDARTRSLRHRREFFRLWAVERARQYATLKYEKFDLRDVAEKPAPDAPADNDQARANRQLACVSQLRETLKQAFIARGGTVQGEEAAFTTQTCPICGFKEKFDAASYVEHRCANCGERWDQDDAAANNLLYGLPPPPTPPDVPRPPRPLHHVAKPPRARPASKKREPV